VHDSGTVGGLTLGASELQFADLGTANAGTTVICIGTSCSAPLTDEGSLRGELERARGRLERV